MNVMTFVKQQWDRVGSWVAIAAGAIVLLCGYIGISNTPHVAAQLPYIISGGLFGIFLLGIGGLLWISADLRDEWSELRGIREALDRVADDRTVEPIESHPLFASDVETTVVGTGSANGNGAVKATAARRRKTTAGA